jgi:hypothetical protein
MGDRGLTRRLALFALAAPLAASVGGAFAQALQSLTIVSGDRRHAFQVELADTDAARAQGLMFRRSLPQERGMLFDFKQVQPISMWMRNTYIPLDMLFIRPDGTVARIAENTEPLSERQIPSGEPVLAVLEVIGGTAKRLGLKAGDRIEHPLFTRR